MTCKALPMPSATCRSSLLACLSVMLAAMLCSAPVTAANVNFSGFLDVVPLDDGGVYTGVPLGTPFTGVIDDVTFSGSITGAGITTDFSCCIAAGGLGVSNNVTLTADEADLLNELVGSAQFDTVKPYDIIDLEGDELTTSGGRIEIGVSYLLDQNAFTDTSPANYPFDPADLIIGAFFITEEAAPAAGGDDIYIAAGLLQPIPVPPAVWLFGSGLMGLVSLARRRKI